MFRLVLCLVYILNATWKQKCFDNISWPWLTFIELQCDEQPVTVCVEVIHVTKAAVQMWLCCLNQTLFNLCWTKTRLLLFVIWHFKIKWTNFKQRVCVCTPSSWLAAQARLLSSCCFPVPQRQVAMQVLLQRKTPTSFCLIWLLSKFFPNSSSVFQPERTFTPTGGGSVLEACPTAYSDTLMCNICHYEVFGFAGWSQHTCAHMCVCLS